MIDANTIDWQKSEGLVPAIIQDAASLQVLMLGYMNAEALATTVERGLVTFYSRSKQRLWTKGETSGHILKLVDIRLDCDADTLLIRAEPQGPTCHTGSDTCWGPVEHGSRFLDELDRLVDQRYRERPAGSYTSELFASGLKRMAQKVGEEGVEVALAAVAGSKDELTGEAADLIFHLLVLLRSQDLNLGNVVECLATRHRPRVEAKA